MTATRSFRERVLQTCVFEVVGIACVTPLFMAFYGGHASESLWLMMAISLAVMLWAPLYGFLFDWIEGRRTNRLSSDRPAGARIVHAVLYEVTSVGMTLPLAMAVGGLSFGQAIGMNIWLTLFYVAYAYAFFLIYDRLRPVRVPA